VRCMTWHATSVRPCHKMTRLERDVQKRISAVDTWQQENEVASVRQDLKSFRQEQRVVNSQTVSVDTMRDHLEAWPYHRYFCPSYI